MTTKKPPIPPDVRAKPPTRPKRPRAEPVPDPQGGIARQLFQVLAVELDPAALSFGGGTVLAARWQHRTSFDVDLFCRPESFERLDATAHARIERSVKNIPGCDCQRTWCEPLALYTEIHRVVATVLPRGTGPAHERQRELAEICSGSRTPKKSCTARSSSGSMARRRSRYATCTTSPAPLGTTGRRCNSC